MNTILIFIWIWAAMIAVSFWEAYAEGRNAWAKKMHCWRIKITKNYELTGYHFWLFYVMFPLFLSLPLVITGWDFKLFGILISAFASGLVIEDFMWFVVNPKVKLKEFNPKFANYYPWLKIGKFQIPVCYVIGVLIAIASWFFLWR